MFRMAISKPSPPPVSPTHKKKYPIRNQDHTQSHSKYSWYNPAQGPKSKEATPPKLDVMVIEVNVFFVLKVTVNSPLLKSIS